MKLFFVISFFVSSSLMGDSNYIQNGNNKLAPCPNSPNCVSTQATKRSKKMDPIPFSGTLSSNVDQLEKMMGIYANATLIEKDGNYLHYEFLTKIGKFVDDVEFLIDGEEKVIHFRSASRKGYGDFGKNKRRMKKIVKEWKKRLAN